MADDPTERLVAHIGRQEIYIEQLKGRIADLEHQLSNLRETILHNARYEDLYAWARGGSHAPVDPQADSPPDPERPAS